MLYGIKFSCPETGENSLKGPFDDWDYALCAKEDPGYGSETIVQLNDEEAIKLIVDSISDLVTELLMDEGLNPDDKNLFYPVFYEYMWDYSDQSQPGHYLVPAYMKDKPAPTRTTLDILGECRGINGNE